MYGNYTFILALDSFLLRVLCPMVNKGEMAERFKAVAC